MRGNTFILLVTSSTAAAVVFGNLKGSNRAITDGPKEVIPGTDIPLPPNYGDYSRGHTPLRLFPGEAPGSRTAYNFTGNGTPTFDPSNPQESMEHFIPSSSEDTVLKKCAPAGHPTGHSFYNVWVPELVPYIVDINDPKRTDAAVIVAPGGGSVNLAWEPEGIAQAEWLNSLGISAFVLKYRVPDRSGLSVMDAQRAMRLVRSKAAVHRLDPNRIGFMGFSAGGRLAERLQLAAESAYTPFDSIDLLSFKPNFLIMIFPGIEPSVARRDAEMFPPTFLASAFDDPCVFRDKVRALRTILESSMRRPLFAVEYPSGGHGWDDCEYHPHLKGLPNCHWQGLARGFLAMHVLPQLKSPDGSEKAGPAVSRSRAGVVNEQGPA